MVLSCAEGRGHNLMHANTGNAARQDSASPHTNNPYKICWQSALSLPTYARKAPALQPVAYLLREAAGFGGSRIGRLLGNRGTECENHSCAITLSATSSPSASSSGTTGHAACAIMSNLRCWSPGANTTTRPAVHRREAGESVGKI